MAGLVPFNRNSRNELTHRNSPWQNIHNMLDSFFTEDTIMRNFNENFKIDIKNNDNDYVVQADLPGMKKEDVKISFNDGTLTISVNKEENRDSNNDNYIHRERSFSSMSRSMYLENVNSESIKAKLDEGVLTISLPKSSASESKKDITVE